LFLFTASTPPSPADSGVSISDPELLDDASKIKSLPGMILQLADPANKDANACLLIY